MDLWIRGQRCARLDLLKRLKGWKSEPVRHGLVAVTWPIPDPDPVTMAIFPSRRAIACRSFAVSNGMMGLSFDSHGETICGSIAGFVGRKGEAG